jgi:hypothetical protein
VFVFGSNLAGRHGAGTALWALNHCGAIYGQGEGLQGDSYAIPTKDRRIKTLPISDIVPAIERFKEFARTRPDLEFEVTNIGCGLAGYSPSDIAPLFIYSPPNVKFSETFQKIIARWESGI